MTLYNITPIPALDTNYIWLLQPNTDTKDVWVVDPGEAEPVLNHLQQHQLQLAGILITHHHRDHIAGVDPLCAHLAVPVYGPDSDKIPQISNPLADGDRLKCSQLSLQIIAVPGHTLEHIIYFHPGTTEQAPFIFCGDSLFAAGCGRRFEGSAETMWASLERMAALPEQTLVYCAHEYTLANLQFAQAMEPDNIEIRQRLEATHDLRQAGEPSLPSEIGIEKRTNPFLRCQLPQLKQAAEQHTAKRYHSNAEVFGALRRLKDTW